MATANPKKKILVNLITYFYLFITLFNAGTLK